MQPGYYLSTYLAPPTVSGLLGILSRHDQNVALWHLDGFRHLDLVRLWELERFSGEKHHWRPFADDRVAQSWLDGVLGSEGSAGPTSGAGHRGRARAVLRGVRHHTGLPLPRSLPRPGGRRRVGGDRAVRRRHLDGRRLAGPHRRRSRRRSGRMAQRGGRMRSTGTGVPQPAVRSTVTQRAGPGQHGQTAPVVAAGRADDHRFASRRLFCDPAPSPFMLRTFRVRDAVREHIPAVLHVDGTARVQTIEQDHSPRVYELIERFAAETGVPMLGTAHSTAGGSPSSRPRLTRCGSASEGGSRCAIRTVGVWSSLAGCATCGCWRHRPPPAAGRRACWVRRRCSR